MAAPNNTLGLLFVANHDSYVDTIPKKETVIRCQFHRHNKGRIFEKILWVAASSRLKSTVLLPRLDNSYPRVPDDNLEWRKGIPATREVLNG